MSSTDVQERTESSPGAPKHKWRRRIKLAAILLVIAAITLRIAMIFALPAVLAFFALQKKLARGIVTTGLKG